MKYCIRIAILLLVVFTASCEKEEDFGLYYTPELYDFIDVVMDEWYLWNDMITGADRTLYQELQDYVDALTVEQDEWSMIGREYELQAYFEKGEDAGFGFFIGWDEPVLSSSSSLRVMFIYNNTQAYKAGVRRGWSILEIDGTPIHDLTSLAPFYNSEPQNMQFKFRTNEGTERTISLNKETYNSNAVLYTDVYEVNTKKVGYMVYQSFLEYSEAELDTTIRFFKNQNIDEIVIDLRFNTGGAVSLAIKMANALAPVSNSNQVFYQSKHNTSKAGYDSTLYFSIDENNLDLSRVFFITNQYSASASELVINGLEPHMDVYSIGDKTHGKPVAMYGFRYTGSNYYENWLFFPVTAKLVNSNGYGDYFGGILPDISVYDNFHYDWGDLNDPALKQAFHYITYGSFNLSEVKSAAQSGNAIPTGKIEQNLLFLDR